MSSTTLAAPDRDAGSDVPNMSFTTLAAPNRGTGSAENIVKQKSAILFPLLILTTLLI